MATNFPNSPNEGDIHQVADRAWQWDGEKWKATGTTSSSAVGAVVVFEGATADAHETTLTVVDPTADATLNLPAMSAGTYYVPVLAAAGTSRQLARNVLRRLPSGKRRISRKYLPC